MRLLILILSLLYIVTSSSYSVAVTKLVASKEAPKPLPPVLIPAPLKINKVTESNSNNNSLYSELIVIKNKVTQLELKLSEQDDTKAIESLKRDVRNIKRSITKLKTTITTNQEANSVEITNIKSQIKQDDTFSYMLSIIFLLAIIIIGFLVVIKVKKEIKKMIDKSHVENERRLLLKLRNAITTTEPKISKEDTP